MTAPMLFEAEDATMVAAAEKVEIATWKFNHKGKAVTAFGSKIHDTRVVIYRNHRVYREAYPGENYGVTDWQHIHKHVDVATRAEAVALAEKWARAGIAAGYPSRY